MKRHIKSIIVLTLAGALCAQLLYFASAAGAVFDPSFESGLSEAIVVNGSVVSGDIAVDTTGINGGYKWTVSPNGTKMLALSPTGTTEFQNVKPYLWLSATSAEYVANSFNNKITNCALMVVDRYFNANESFSMAWQYVAKDYAPYNDGAMVSFVNTDDNTSIPVIDGFRSDVAILGSIVSGTGNYTTGNLSATGWQTVTLKANAAGTYRIGFTVFNTVDAVASQSSYLFLDDAAGTTTRNGLAFDPIDRDPNPPTAAGSLVPAEINCSGGTSSCTPGAAAVKVDNSLTVTGADVTGAKVTITDGFEPGDTLSFTDANGITGSYDAGMGVLTLSGTAKSGAYEAALRAVTFSTSGGAGQRTIVFSLGGKLSYGGHYYEVVHNGSNITWTDAKAAAAAGAFYGGNGYLAVITSDGENSFLRDKLGADAWIGASDAAIPEEWVWAVDAPAPETGTAFYNGSTNQTAAGYYANWDTVAGEPSGDSGLVYAAMKCSGSAPGRWYSLADDAAITGYIVEYNGVEEASSTKTIVAGTVVHPPVPPAAEPVTVIVNGVAYSAGTLVQYVEDGRRVLQAAVNKNTIKEKIESAEMNGSGNSVNSIQIPFSGTSDVIKAKLAGDIIGLLDEYDFTLSVKKGDVEYILPADELDIADVAEALGLDVKQLDRIEYEVRIGKLDDSVAKKYEALVNENGAELIFPPVSFDVTAQTTAADGTVTSITIDRFTNYVQRVIELPAGVEPGKITTGIVFNPDGTYSHVPTVVFQKDGKGYAKINSLTNSVYSVIWNPVTVDSAKGHWSEAAANEMASRLVVFDPQAFKPDGAITRGEFTEYLVRALGLYREQAPYRRIFTDVTEGGARTPAIITAYDYNLISGFSDGTFRPEDVITREEAMAMLARAMDIAHIAASETGRYLTYTDYDNVDDWASSYVRSVLAAQVFNGTTSATVSPRSVLTYAEAVQAIRNLLVASGLIDS